VVSFKESDPLIQSRLTPRDQAHEASAIDLVGQPTVNCEFVNANRCGHTIGRRAYRAQRISIVLETEPGATFVT